MDPRKPRKVFCHNPACPTRGKLDSGNIGIHSLKKRRYICHVCGKTFTESKGTVFYRLRYPVEFVIQIVTLLAHGCPIAAIVAAFRVDERTVASWQSRAGEHCQQVHEHLVQQPRGLGQVQADEIRVKHQGGIAWLAMALQVSTRLWLGGVVSAHRDGKLITHLIEQVCIVQVIKQVSRKRVVGVIRRIAQGTSAKVESLLKQTQNTPQGQVAYMERLNGTFRSRIAALVRRGRSLARQSETLHQAMYLVGTA